jgi:predicted DNA-binding transcriptional regulator YafY
VAETSPTSRALRTLEAIQGSPGISAERLGARLGVSERAARRYVAILREAEIPIESERGPYGGYRVGRGLRLPPLMFTATEAMGLVMAVLEAHGSASGDDPVASAVGKMIRVLPVDVARPLEALREVAAQRTDPDPPHPETTAALVGASVARRRCRIDYAPGPHRRRTLEVDPWAVVVRFGRWYVLGWSHAAADRRIYRIDRVLSVEVLDEEFEPPADLDPFRALEEQMSQGWEHDVDVVIDAPPAEVSRWLPRSLGRTEPTDDGRTRLVGSTRNLEWFATELAEIPAPFTVVGGDEIREAVRVLAERLVAAAGGTLRPGRGTPGPAR